MLADILRAYKNKVLNKTTGVIHVPARGHKKGDVLLSFLTEPFTKAPREFFSDPHTNPWACVALAEMLSERGCAVDIINWDNTTFIPRKPYRMCIDIQKNLERLGPHLPKDCIKIYFILSSYAQFQNDAERTRLEALKARRGTELPMKRREAPTRAPAFADYLVGYGNKTVYGTYAQFNKPVVPIPGPTMHQFPFPEGKDFEKARHEFLWFGGGGAVLKGLDLTLEALAGGPYQLHIVGPAAAEPEFAKVYAKELAAPNVHLYPRPRVDKGGRLTVGAEDFLAVMNKCAAIIFPSASEGGGASALQAMHAGLIPIVTPTSGMSESAPATFVEPTVEAIRAAAETIARTEPAALHERARACWEFARTRHTQAAFRAAWGKFFDTLGL
ncbi:MAG: glycosyltransferase family 4 protein [Patescibacteria group bacterium]|nr:glycosyltransferase family 4 protein [Patescibacteria group bacterium]